LSDPKATHHRHRDGNESPYRKRGANAERIVNNFPEPAFFRRFRLFLSYESTGVNLCVKTRYARFFVKSWVARLRTAQRASAFDNRVEDLGGLKGFPFPDYDAHP
jgi:hypothetical protein